jgi:heptosyltransferase-2
MKRILIRAPNWIGDQVMAYPFFHELRRRYPRAWIGVICTEWVKDIQFRSLVDEVFVLPKNKGDSFFKSARTIFNFAKKIKVHGPWDFGITLPNSFGSALILSLAGAVRKRGYDTDVRSLLLDDKLRWNPSHEIHRGQAYLNLLSPEGQVSLKMPDFDPIREWPGLNPIEPPKDPYFLIAPGATADSRRWPTEKFAELIEKISARFGYQAVVVGGSAEKEIAAQLLKKGIVIEDFTGRGRVAAHWKLFRNARFTICNESGLAHVAALCGSKVQIVCGAADPRRTRPIGPGLVQVKVNPVECWPCEKNVCLYQDERKNRCLEGISADDIFAEVKHGFHTS